MHVGAADPPQFARASLSSRGQYCEQEQLVLMDDGYA